MPARLDPFIFAIAEIGLGPIKAASSHSKTIDHKIPVNYFKSDRELKAGKKQCHPTSSFGLYPKAAGLSGCSR